MRQLPRFDILALPNWPSTNDRRGSGTSARTSNKCENIATAIFDAVAAAKGNNGRLENPPFVAATALRPSAVAARTQWPQNDSVEQPWAGKRVPPRVLACYSSK